MGETPRVTPLPDPPARIKELPAYLAGAFAVLREGQLQTVEHLARLNGTVARHEGQIGALQATCAARGDGCGKQGVVITWKVAGVIVVAVAVLGALLGPDAVKAVAAVLK